MGFENFVAASQLIITINDFATCLENSLQIDAILLDFSKAFDKVDHDILLADKLEHLGIRNSLLDWSRIFFDRAFPESIWSGMLSLSLLQYQKKKKKKEHEQNGSLTKAVYTLSITNCSCH